MGITVREKIIRNSRKHRPSSGIAMKANETITSDKKPSNLLHPSLLNSSNSSEMGFQNSSSLSEMGLQNSSNFSELGLLCSSNLSESSLQQSSFPLDMGLPKLFNYTDIGDGNERKHEFSEMDESDWGYCTESQLEDLLLKNLEFLYNEALCKLVSLGYDEETALKAVLQKGHCYGSSDVLSNILQNTLSYLNSNGTTDESELVFADLKQLEEYSLAGMVCLLQQVRPQLSKGDAMWCLLMSDLHVGRASTLDIPCLPPPCTNRGTLEPEGNTSGPENGDLMQLPMNPSSSVGSQSQTCDTHNLDSPTAPLPMNPSSSLGSHSQTTSNTQQPDSLPTPSNGIMSSSAPRNSTFKRTALTEFPLSFCISPHMKLVLKRTMASYNHRGLGDLKLGAHASSNPSPNCQHSPLVCLNKKVQTWVASGKENSIPMKNLDNDLPDANDQSRANSFSDMVNYLLGSLENMNLDEKLENGSDDPRNEMLLKLMDQIRDLEGQLKERIDWAHQKAMQAARKLSNDLTELKTLRIEKDETLLLKKGQKQALEDTTMKRLSDLENALRKASAQVDRANAAVRKLETENAEIRAEMEASKLSAAESVSTCLEVAKREKKCLKRLLAWEKQKTKLQEEVAAEKQKIIQLQQQLSLTKELHKETEIKWKLDMKAREEAIAQAEEVRRAKEAAEVSIKRRQEALRRKIEIDFQRHKDDIQRLEQEHSRLKSYAESAKMNGSKNSSDRDGTKAWKETDNQILQELWELQESSKGEVGRERKCLICMRDKVSVVFLPCAHQILCADCSESHEKQAKKSCPSCGVLIDQRIRVFGVTS
ncbi:MND1-interacting protein 1 [Amborella trichopoda]|nr:MND1-interacting protein 1 [Amborella trichopoda]|eukprot:XP_006847705.2 MND1-interacting protein 1 [Amborella trichopoda]